MLLLLHSAELAEKQRAKEERLAAIKAGKQPGAAGAARLAQAVRVWDESTTAPPFDCVHGLAAVWPHGHYVTVFFAVTSTLSPLLLTTLCTAPSSLPNARVSIAHRIPSCVRHRQQQRPPPPPLLLLLLMHSRPLLPPKPCRVCSSLVLLAKRPAQRVVAALALA